MLICIILKCYSGTPFYPIPRRRGAESRPKVCERALTCSVWSNYPSVLTILSYTPMNSLWSDIHVQDHHWKYIYRRLNEEHRSGILKTLLTSLYKGNLTVNAIRKRWSLIWVGGIERSCRRRRLKTVWVGSPLGNAARNSSHFVWRASSVSLRTSVLASRYSVRFSVTVLRRLFP